MLCYHGTTKKAYEQIIKNGFQNTNVKNWNVSENDVSYFFPLDKVASGELGYFDIEDDDIEDLDNEDLENCKNLAIRNAFGQAQITTAIQKNIYNNETYVFEMEINDSLLQDDYSCDNMEDIASSCFNNDISIKNIVNVYKCDYDVFMTYFVLCGMLENQYIDLTNYNDNELLAIKQLGENDICMDSLLEFDFQKINVDMV